MIRSIVVGTDGSETATEAVRQAGELAQSVGASLHVVSAYEPARGARRRVRSAAESAAWQAAPDVEVDAAARAGSRRACTRAESSASAHARRGDPAEAILRVAEEERRPDRVGNKGMHGSRALPARQRAGQDLAPRALQRPDRPDDRSPDYWAGR